MATSTGGQSPQAPAAQTPVQTPAPAPVSSLPKQDDIAVRAQQVNSPADIRRLNAEFLANSPATPLAVPPPVETNAPVEATQAPEATPEPAAEPVAEDTPAEPAPDAEVPAEPAPEGEPQDQQPPEDGSLSVPDAKTLRISPRDDDGTHRLIWKIGEDVSPREPLTDRACLVAGLLSHTVLDYTKLGH